MTDVLAYEHSLPPTHFAQLCALPEVLARYSEKARGSEILNEIREECRTAPADPKQEGNRILDLDSESHNGLLALLDFAASASGDEKFALLALDLRRGAAETYM